MAAGLLGGHVNSINTAELAAWARRQFGALAPAYVDECLKASASAGDVDQTATWMSVKQMLHAGTLPPAQPISECAGS